MISGFAKAFQALGDPRYLEAAQRAGDFIGHNRCPLTFACGAQITLVLKVRATRRPAFVTDRDQRVKMQR